MFKKIALPMFALSAVLATTTFADTTSEYKDTVKMIITMNGYACDDVHEVLSREDDPSMEAVMEGGSLAFDVICAQTNGSMLAYLVSVSAKGFAVEPIEENS